MRILVLNYEFPPVGGGGGRVAEDICRGLSSRGHLVRVHTSLVHGLPRLEARDGYTIYRTFVFRRKRDSCSVAEMAAYLALSIIPALRHAAFWKPDLVHVHFAVPTGVLGWVIRQITGIPYVITAHLGDVPGGVPDQTDRLFRLIMPATKMIWSQASRITAVSEFTKELALRAYRVPVKVIPNGLDLSRCSVESYEVHDPVRLLFVGRLNAQKNLPFFLRVLNRVKDLRWHFDILGDGPQRQEIESDVATLGLVGRVKMRGWVEPSVVDELMRESDVLALPSTSEGMPIAALRALGFALAVLGSRIGGLKDLVQEGENGFLCSVNDEAGFETRLRELVGTPDRLAAMKKRSRNLAQRFCMEAITSEYEETFREVLR